ncbi:acyl-CoA dehydrogenase [Nocardiopsis gilva YIM 90087]|uniref:Acyl-CoA dehydrogenase n=1 Tax=Nocardiopsis gilva YIM 90087 TaxID=1235441 RepID=A0A223S6T4_9ACTN|nr:acyl-CoA dehydrogenase family protein [Nocardiopsis gilva]ASU83812.1 acyl-CoA dehydrogenase [Nocardiopsis gilva YIM 90087]
MRFSAEQEELRTTVRTLVERRGGTPQREPGVASEDVAEDVWRLLAEQVGAHALAVPEKLGGAGYSCLETHVVMEELGRALTPIPFLGSAVLTTQALLACDDAPARAEWLPRLTAGTLVGALAWAERGSFGTDAIATRAVSDSGGTASGSPRAQPTSGPSWRLTGVKEHVLDAGRAGLLLVAARTDRGLAVLAVDRAAPGVTVEPQVPMDLSRPQGRVLLDAAPATLLTSHGERVMRHVLDTACTALSAEQVGGAAHCLDMTVAYARQRVQFGRPIGAFQAVKHRLADMYVLLESARSASYAAAFALANGAPDASAVAALAKSSCSEAFRTIAGEAIQLHGGIGITWEHDCHRYFKRAHGSALLFGSPEWHRRRLAHGLGLTGGGNATRIAGSPQVADRESGTVRG